MARKKVYICKVCNAYLAKDANEPVPVCCGDEFDEDQIYQEKGSSGGL